MPNSTVIWGWHQAPNERGTLEIVWNSILTIGLCSWTALCLNIPPRTWKTYKWLYQKFLVALLCVMGPEFIFQSAFGQWSSARRSVLAFQELDHDDWTMTHAFLADMGGFVLDVKDCPEYPLDAKQLHYLVKHGHISYKQIATPKDEIKDMNKVDSMIRVLTLLQILWFVLNTIARAIKHLPITILEISTLGFIVPTIGVYYFWFKKPLDLRTQKYLRLEVTLAEIFEAHKQRLREAGEIPPEETLIPLDFVGRDVWSFNKIWSMYIGVARYLGCGWAVAAGNRQQMINDDAFPFVPRWGIYLSIFTQSVYAAVHAIGWNFFFPSDTERFLWHLATLATPFAILVYWTNHYYMYALHDQIVKALGMHHSTIAELEKRPEPRPRSIVGRIAAKMRNMTGNSDYGYDPRLTLPLSSAIVMLILALIYCLGRVYVLVECLVSLRALPNDAYQTVEWTDFIPHIH